MQSIEELLLAKIQADNAEKPTTQEMLLGGAGIGAVGGAVLGQIPHSIGNRVGNAVNSITGKAPSSGFQKILRPGFRMAGGLTGAVLGGALGAGIRQTMMNESPEAQLLAKAQVQGELNDQDQRLLQSLIADTYSQMGLT